MDIVFPYHKRPQDLSLTHVHSRINGCDEMDNGNWTALYI